MPNRDLNLLYPPFRMQVEELLRRLEEAKLPFYIFEALRTFEEQASLYAQGRSKSGQIVTNAQPGDSFHSYGLAVDLVLDGQPDKPGIQWSWDTRADLNAGVGMTIFCFCSQSASMRHSIRSFAFSTGCLVEGSWGGRDPGNRMSDRKVASNTTILY